MISAPLLSAVIQAVIMAIILAVTLVGIALWFGGKMSNISAGIESMDDSIGAVENDVRDVDFKEIEKTVFRLEYAIDDISEAGNSVYYELPQSGIGVTISLAAEPSDELIDPVHGVEPEEFVRKKHTEETIDGMIEQELDEDEELGEVDQDEIISERIAPEITPDFDEGLIVEAGLPDSEITYIRIEFDDRIRSKAVTDKLVSDQELSSLEKELFGYQCGFNALSPIEVEFSIPSADYSKIADWIPKSLEKIDQYHCEFEEEAKEFDTVIESALE